MRIEFDLPDDEAPLLAALLGRLPIFQALHELERQGMPLQQRLTAAGALTRLHAAIEASIPPRHQDHGNG